MQEAPTRETTAGVVVTFNPPEGFERRLASLANHVDRVLIVDNGSARATLERLHSQTMPPRVELHLNGRNLGVATAFNQGVEWARARGYRWLLLSDHDTEFDESASRTLRSVWESYPERDRIAVIGCNFVDANLDSTQYPATAEEPTWSERETVISSGSLLSLCALEQLGPLRDEFFIDQVDHEYCLRARSKGFRIVATGRAVMRHSVGTGKTHGRLLGVVSLNHPPQRWYYFLRNEVGLIREYCLREPHWALVTFVSRARKTLAMMILEKDRLAKLRYAAAGFADGVRGRYGPYRA